MGTAQIERPQAALSPPSDRLREHCSRMGKASGRRRRILAGDDVIALNAMRRELDRIAARYDFDAVVEDAEERESA